MATGTIGDGAVPLVSSDFKNGVYMVTGEVVDHDDLWEAGDDWDYLYSEEVITEGVGLRYTLTRNGSFQNITGGPKMVDAAAAPLLAGYVAIYDFTVSGWVDDGDLSGYFNTSIMDYPGLAYGIQQDVLFDPDGPYIRVIYTNPVSSESAARTINDGAHRVATSLTPAEVAASIDGTANVLEGEYTPAGAFDAVVLYTSLQDLGGDMGTFSFTLEKIEFYDPADYVLGSLPGLSAP